MNIIKFLVLFIFAGLMTGCSNQKEEKSSNDDSKNSQNLLAWKGTYVGVIPCADCEGIEIKLTLAGDQTFNKLFKYLGKDDNVYEDNGDFIWNASGDGITLRLSSGKEEQYIVGENYLVMLDQKGERIEGELEDKYKLYKSDIDNYDFSYALDKKWLLKEINGRRIDDAGIYITFQKEENLITGFGSCNNFNGNYTLGESGSFKISDNIAMTKMLCPTHVLEAEFMDVLTRIDGFFIYKNQLMLTKAKRSAIAVFEIKI